MADKEGGKRWQAIGADRRLETALFDNGRSLVVSTRPGKRCRRPMIGTSNALPPQSTFVVGMTWPWARFICKLAVESFWLREICVF
jgi:hypothetical protein